MRQMNAEYNLVMQALNKGDKLPEVPKNTIAYKMLQELQAFEENALRRLQGESCPHKERLWEKAKDSYAKAWDALYTACMCEIEAKEF